jgi:hypothetical protein
MAAVSQIRYRGTEGRVYCERKNGEGMTGRCALRALKTQYQRVGGKAWLTGNGGSGRPGVGHGTHASEPAMSSTG